MLKFAKKSIFATCMALVLTFMTIVPAYATEASVGSSDIKIISGNLQVEDVTDNIAQTRGNLSGYKCMAIKGSGSASFVMDVSGSWSPWAGCTLKSTDFSPNTTIEVTLRLGDDEKFKRTLGPNTEVRNIAMLNVDPGGYTVEITVNNNSNKGYLHIWIY